MIFELKFRIQHPCAYLDFSNLFGKKTMYSYCSRTLDIIIIPAEEDPSREDRLLAQGEHYFSNFNSWKIKKTGKNTMIFMNCFCIGQQSSISGEIQERGAVSVYPTMYKNGWEHHKVIAFSDEMVDDLITHFEAYPMFEVLSRRQYDDEEIIKHMTTLDDVVDTLTEKQNRTLLQAYESGYYSIPRKVKSEVIADKLGVSRYGFQKTLRLAESSLMKSITPYLYFRKHKN